MKRALESWPWFAVLLVPSLVPALSVIGSNPVGIPHVERLLMVSMGTWVVACLMSFLLQLYGLTAVRAVAVAFVASVAFYWGGSVTRTFGTVGGILVIASLLLVLALLMARTTWESSFKVILVAVSVALLTGPAVDLVASATSNGVNVVDDGTTLSFSMDEKPDVWLVVLDGHPGLPTMSMDFGATTTESVLAPTAATGLDLRELAWSAYWTTDYSLPSILNMGYPTTQPITNHATKRVLYEMIGGENRLTDALLFNGYETYMVESGWSGSSCSDRIHTCVPSPWLDEPMFFMLGKSLINDYLLSQFGYAFTAGATATMEWALSNASSIASDGVPSFVFAHVMAPHPPFLLSQDCDVAFSQSRAGVTFNHSGADPTDRDGYLLDQIVCVQDFITELGSRIHKDDVLVVVSDHGTDRRNQLIADPSQWTSEALVERMGVFLAISPSACAVETNVLLPNVMRQVMDCYSSSEIQNVNERMFIGPEAEVSTEDIHTLMEYASQVLSGSEAEAG